MTNFAWMSDIHLDHLRNDDDVIAFCNRVQEANPNGIFITGDISNGKSIEYHLGMLERHIRIPKYFVLGNHDFWYTSIERKRKEIKELCEKFDFLKYMTTSTYVSLSKETAILGHDGWYDAQIGNAKDSNFIMNDWVLTHEFIQASGGEQYIRMMRQVKDKDALIKACQKLAKESVDHVSTQIKDATRYHKNIIILTHIPAFEESHMFKGEVGDANAQPWYTSKIMGDTVFAAANHYRNCKFTLLSGHTHGFFKKDILPNLKVIVSDAVYGSPYFYEIDIK